MCCFTPKRPFPTLPTPPGPQRFLAELGHLRLQASEAPTLEARSEMDLPEARGQENTDSVEEKNRLLSVRPPQNGLKTGGKKVAGGKKTTRF